jgi:hypothetical protein
MQLPVGYCSAGASGCNFLQQKHSQLCLDELAVVRQHFLHTQEQFQLAASSFVSIFSAIIASVL